MKMIIGVLLLSAVSWCVNAQIRFFPANSPSTRRSGAIPLPNSPVPSNSALPLANRAIPLANRGTNSRIVPTGSSIPSLGQGIPIVTNRMITNEITRTRNNIPGIFRFTMPRLNIAPNHMSIIKNVAKSAGIGIAAAGGSVSIISALKKEKENNSAVNHVQNSAVMNTTILRNAVQKWRNGIGSKKVSTTAATTTTTAATTTTTTTMANYPKPSGYVKSESRRAFIVHVNFETFENVTDKQPKIRIVPYATKSPYVFNRSPSSTSRPITRVHPPYATNNDRNNRVPPASWPRPPYVRNNDRNNRFPSAGRPGPPYRVNNNRPPMPTNRHASSPLPSSTSSTSTTTTATGMSDSEDLDFQIGNLGVKNNGEL